MSTIKSSTEHLTLNADGSGKEIKFQCNGTEVAKTTSTGIDVTGSVTCDGIVNDSSQWVKFGSANTFFSSTAVSGLLIQSPSGADNTIFRTSTGSEKVRFPATGGITFNGDTAAANALDDYEEGTWTPTFSGMTLTGNTISGKYVKIGNMVTVTVYLLNVTATGTRTHSMTGLPFTCGAHRGSVNFVTHHQGFSTAVPCGIVANNTAKIEFLYNRADASWVGATLKTGSSIYVHSSATYYVS